ncbi:MAG TPA: regulatory protein RecX [bacterium]
MRIVRLEPPKGRWGHQRLTLDDGTKLHVRPEDVTTLGLEDGGDVSEDLLLTLQLRDAVAGGKTFAHRLLTIRPRSRHEVLTRLQLRRVPSPAIAEILAELERDGLLDDARFARMWVDSRTAHRPSGAVRLRAELRRKGVDRRTIDEALSARLAPADESALALSVARAIARRYRTLDRQTATRRLAGALERRGFSTHVILETLAAVLGTPADSVNA